MRGQFIARRKKAFDHRPGQCAILSVPGVGEAMFSTTSSPTNEEYREEPYFVKALQFDTNKTAVLCGPPIMIKFTLEGLGALGFDKTHIYTTLELRMKCGVGKCGRCNVGSKYVCKDGPVFRCDELDELPDEY